MQIKNRSLTIQNALEKDDGQYPHAPDLSISKLRFFFDRCALFLRTNPCVNIFQLSLISSSTRGDSYEPKLSLTLCSSSTRKHARTHCRSLARVAEVCAPGKSSPLKAEPSSSCGARWCEAGRCDAESERVLTESTAHRCSLIQRESPIN